MMNKFINITAVLLLCLASCQDSLEKVPLDKVDLNNYFTSATDMELYSNGWYIDILEKKPYDNQDDYRINRNLSELLKCGTARSTPQSGGGWNWEALRDINTLLEIAPKNCKDKEALRKYTALARYFRAHFYFEKVKRFGDVPWIDRPLGSSDPSLMNPRDSRELVMTKMIEDIDYAIDNLPSDVGPYHVTSAAALALKSNFCLFEGTFRKYHNINLEGHNWEYYLECSIDAAEKLMSGKYGSFKLYSTKSPDKDYRDLFASLDAKKEEVILAVKYSIAPSVGHNVNAWSLSSNSSGPQFTRKFVCTYLMKDGSRFTEKSGWQTMSFVEECKDRDPRMSQTMRTPGYMRINGNEVLATDLGVSFTGYQPIKYVTQSAIGDYVCDQGSRAVNDMPVYRYAETLLNYAEAKAELGQLTQSDLDKSVNLIRKRAGMPDMKIGNTPDPYLLNEETGYFNSEIAGSQQGDVLEIRRERCIEMAMENRRFFDLIRWKSGLSWSQNLYGIYIPGPCQLDVTGDGKPDYVFYAKGTVKPSLENGMVAYEIGKDIILSEETKGYIDMHSGQIQGVFNENRDYLFPIPLDDLQLNHNLVQNPGWTDIDR